MTTGFGLPFGITVTVQRQAEDAFGNFTPAGAVPSPTLYPGPTVYPGAVERQIGPCVVAPTASTELTDQRETVTSTVTLLVPPGSDVQPTDRIVLPDGSRWSVVGNVLDFVNPFTGWHPGMTVQMQRVTG